MAKRQAHFQLVQSNVPKRWFWRLKGGNGEILATSELMNSKAACLRSIAAARNASPVIKLPR